VDGGEEEEEGGRVIGQGLNAFVVHVLDRQTDKAVKKNALVRNVLVSSANRHHLHTVNTYCFATLLDHILRSSYPEDVQSAFVRFDASIGTTAELALSFDLEGVALQRARLPLPPSKTGLLLRQRGGLDAFLPHAALWDGAARALPSFANRLQANPQGGGEAEGGVLPELTDLVGDGSFEKDGSGCGTR
jgi:hypothetical protein